MISFLLGAGFSKADGVPLISDIRDQLSELTVDDIYIHSDLKLIVLNGQDKPTPLLHEIEENFIIRFINFYSDNYELNYEYLFDYVNEYLRNGGHQEEIEDFYDRFVESQDVDQNRIPTCNNILESFKKYFQQIISSFLTVGEYFKDVGLGNYPPYDPFFNFIKQLINEKNEDICVHTLNHDLLFEHVASKLSGLWENFDDGYRELGSPYYGEVNIEEGVRKSYKIRVKYFVNKYEKPLTFYKLHGSIDTYDFDIRIPDSDRVKTDYRVGSIFREVFNKEQNSFKYVRSFRNHYPDFLTGTTGKTVGYRDEYYSILIDHFKNNLQNSDLLIVIGYSFGDEGINDLLWENYLSKDKQVVIIDIEEPDFPFKDEFDSNCIIKEFKDVTLEEYLDLI